VAEPIGASRAESRYLSPSGPHCALLGAGAGQLARRDASPCAGDHAAPGGAQRVGREPGTMEPVGAGSGREPLSHYPPGYQGKRRGKMPRKSKVNIDTNVAAATVEEGALHPPAKDAEKMPRKIQDRVDRQHRRCSPVTKTTDTAPPEGARGSSTTSPRRGRSQRRPLNAPLRQPHRGRGVENYGTTKQPHAFIDYQRAPDLLFSEGTRM